MVIHFAGGMVSYIMSQKPLYMNAKFCLIKIELHLLHIYQKIQTTSFQMA